MLNTTNARAMKFLLELSDQCTEFETTEGYTWEDASVMLNDLILTARQITGHDPGRPVVYCPECLSGKDECECYRDGLDVPVCDQL